MKKFFILLLVMQMTQMLPEDYFLTTTRFQNLSEYKIAIQVNLRTYYSLDLQLVQTLNGDIFTKNFQLLIYNNSHINHEYDFSFLQGAVVNFNGSVNRVSGYLKRDCFYGSLHLGSMVYFVEEIEDYPEFGNNNTTLNALIYSRLWETNNKEELRPKHIDRFKRGTDQNAFKLKERIGKGKVCTLGVILDVYYICKGNNNDVNKAVSMAKDSIEEANIVFRNTDFSDDGQPNNIGIKIKKMILILTPEESGGMPPYETLTHDIGFILRVGELRIFEDVCLGLMMTSYIVKQGILGESFQGFPNEQQYSQVSGGICDRPMYQDFGYRNFNCFYTRFTGSTVNLYFTVTHELGHSFGSPHDESKECKGYVMEPVRPVPFLEENLRFSSCSKKIMARVIMSKGFCMEDETESFCGNGIVEPGEECDCGTNPQCRYDQCCYPRGAPNGMQCKKTGECHPSDGLCCNEDCRYNDFSKINLDCRNSIKKCPCSTKPCICGIDATCIGNECHSIECTRLNLQECSCPKSSSPVPCENCCKYKEKCQPASLVTQSMTENNATLIEKLQSSIKLKAELATISKEFCARQKCVRLSFKNSMTLCSVFGKLGRCLDNGICVVHIRQAIFSSTPVGNSYKFFCCWKNVSLSIFVVISWKINLM